VCISRFLLILGEKMKSEKISVYGKVIQYDKSGVGHCWVPADEVDCPPSIQEEIAGEINDLNWTDERCAQLANMQRVLHEVASANSANNFIRRIAEASELADSLMYGSYPSFVAFLNMLAADCRKKNV